MAEFGAHLTSQSNVARPSIFEVLAQDNLSIGLRRAAQYLIRILYQNNPAKFSSIYNHFDNLYLLFDFVVQYSHLRAFNASFSENFYGLKRIDAKHNNQRLTSKQIYSSLLFLIGYPYLKIKLDNLHQRLKYDLLEGKRLQSVQLWFVKVYPTFCSVWNGLLLYYQIKYAVGKGNYHSPLLRLASVELRCLTQEDLNERNTKVLLEPNLSWFNYLKRISWICTKYCATGLGAGLSFGAFFIQFLDYWYTRESAPPSFASLPIPPPPPKESIEIPVNICPICNQIRKNDTVLSTTGFVFCYSCIRSFVLKNNKCPVTGYPSSINHIIKLYPPEN